KKANFGVTELETFADCSSIWFVDRLIGPRTIDQVVDPRLRGQVAHSALHKFFAGVPKRLGVEKLGAEQLDDALEHMRECLSEAMAGVRMELTDLQRRELEQGLLRDLVGVEPLGGIYRALSGKRDARGLLRAEAKEDGVPGYSRNDYLDEEAFWGQVDRAQELARGFVERIRNGDVQHDPKGGDCPPWCELWRMCRVRRP